MTGNPVPDIVNLVNLYAVAVDSRQWQLFDQVFTPDAVTDFGGGAAFSGLETIRTIFATIHDPFDSTLHVTTNHQVSAQGAGATCLSYVHGRFVRDLGEGGSMFESAGWYDDALVLTDGGWRIARRTCRTVWWGGNPRVLQTDPNVHVETVLNALHRDAAQGTVGHIARLMGRG
ncbi:MAG TPA: nuclear transport factor 2 family protein [Novosphingobium sp.]|nr:nuclear transport factor 2 family protein [Novosphingobium sp.]